MNAKALERIYAGIILTIFWLIVLHAPLTVWLGSEFPGLSDVLKAWKEIFMLPAVMIAAVLMSRHNLWRVMFDDWLVRLIIVYGALHLVMLLVFWNGVSATLAGLAIDLRYIVFFSLVYVLISLYPAYRRPLIVVTLAGAMVVGLFALLQITVLSRDVLTHIGYGSSTIEPYLTVDKNPDYVRINSTLRGPNPLGLYAGIVLSFVLAAVLHKRKQLSRWKYTAGVIALGAAVGLYASYSRSALLAAFVAFGIIIFVSYGKRLSRKSWSLLALAAVIIAIVFVAGRESNFVANVILHDDPNTGSSVTSNDAHVSSLQNGLERFASQPLGSGIGSSGPASLYSDKPQIIENQYLLIAHEAGWLGLGLFVAIFVLIMERLWRARSDWLALAIFASGAGIALAGVLLPVWVDDTVAIIWWGGAGIIVGGYNAKHTR